MWHWPIIWEIATNRSQNWLYTIQPKHLKIDILDQYGSVNSKLYFYISAIVRKSRSLGWFMSTSPPASHIHCPSLPRRKQWRIWVLHIEHRAAAHHRQVRFSDLTFLLKIVSSKPPAAAVNGMNFHKMLLEFPIDLWSAFDFHSGRHCRGTLTCSHRSKFWFDFCDKDCQFTCYCFQWHGFPQIAC